MLKIRKESIDALLKICYATIDKVEQGGICQAPNSRMQEECYVLTLGSLVHRFKSLNMWNPRRTSSDVYQSIQSFHDTLKQGKVHLFPNEGKGYSSANHHGCSPSAGMLTEFSEMFSALPSPVQDHHLRHIKCQAKKGLTKK